MERNKRTYSSIFGSNPKNRVLKCFSEGQTSSKIQELFLKKLEGGINKIDKRDKTKSFAKPVNSTSNLKLLTNDEDKNKELKDGSLHINQYIHDWILKQQSKKIPTCATATLIKETATLHAKATGVSNFEATSEWFDQLCAQYQLRLVPIANRISVDYLNNDIFLSFPSENIFDVAATNLHYKVLPDETLMRKYDSRETCEDKFTILLAANLTGEKLKPLIVDFKLKDAIVGDVESQTVLKDCLQSVNLKNLPVIYKTTCQSFMGFLVFQEWIRDLDRQFAKENRKVIFFLIRNSAHRPVKNLSHIKLFFYPSEVTQPLHLDVIRNFNIQYNRRLLSYLTSRVGQDCYVLKEITILDAIYWIDSAWKDIPSSLITTSFNKCGFVGTQFLDCSMYENESNKDIYRMIEFLKKRKNRVSLNGVASSADESDKYDYDSLDEQIREPEVVLKVEDEYEIKANSRCVESDVPRDVLRREFIWGFPRFNIFATKKN